MSADSIRRSSVSSFWIERRRTGAVASASHFFPATLPRIFSCCETGEIEPLLAWIAQTRQDERYPLGIKLVPSSLLQ